MIFRKSSPGLMPTRSMNTSSSLKRTPSRS
jgi:hypothetical protein